MTFDLTTDVGEVAVLPTGAEPTEPDWVAADWVREAPSGPSKINRYSTVYRYMKVTATVDGETDSAWLRLLIGPDGVVALPDSPAAKVGVYGRITDSPEIVVLLFGALTIGF